MSEWKEASNKRRNFRQCKNPLPQISAKKTSINKRFRFVVQIQTIKRFFIWDKLFVWRNFRRYKNESRAEQAVKNLASKEMYKDHEFRIISK